MNAFTYCTNLECPKRDRCRRAVQSDDPWQSNAFFSKVLGDTECFGFIPIRAARTDHRWNEERSA